MSMQNCTGLDALQYVQDLLDACQESSPGMIDSDKVPFESHVNISNSLLRNPDDTQDGALATTFYVYITQMSWAKQRRRFVDHEDQIFPTFFQGDPPKLPRRKTVIRYPKFGGINGQRLKEYLKGQAEKFKENEELGELIRRLRDEVTSIVDDPNRTKKDQFGSTSMPSLVEVVHGMLGYYLKEYRDHLDPNTPKANKTLRQLLEASHAYLDLTFFVEKMHYLIKAYVQFIEEAPEVTSNLRTTPTLALRRYEESASGTPSYEHAVDKSLRSDHSSVPPLDLPEVHELDVNFDDIPVIKTNTWGTCAKSWLDALIAQGHAAKWLWARRNEYRFTMEVLSSTATAARFSPWEEQIQLKDLLENPDLFDQISAILKCKTVRDFYDPVHAELVVVAELLKRGANNTSLMGISRPPCFVCYQVLETAAKECGLKCRPARDSGQVWTMDFPTQLPDHILSETLKKLSLGAAQTFDVYRPLILRNMGALP